MDRTTNKLTAGYRFKAGFYQNVWGKRMGVLKPPATTAVARAAMNSEERIIIHIPICILLQTQNNSNQHGRSRLAYVVHKGGFFKSILCLNIIHMF